MFRESLDVQIAECSKKRGLRHALILALCIASGATAQEKVGTRWMYATPDARFQVEVVTTALTAPAGLSFLPADQYSQSRPGTRASGT